eukprot:GHVU01002509.1.p2 GENE.GHVU01002509.1~~GHVU01002509.1.p2  ORF type:complete len:118 (-),score=15.18 GHVU01002509.1:266-619(-)
MPRNPRAAARLEALGAYIVRTVVAPNDVYYTNFDGYIDDLIWGTLEPGDNQDTAPLVRDFLDQLHEEATYWYFARLEAGLAVVEARLPSEERLPVFLFDTPSTTDSEGHMSVDSGSE